MILIKLGDKGRKKEWIKLKFGAYVIETELSEASNKG
jgi:hypothetical protein